MTSNSSSQESQDDPRKKCPQDGSVCLPKCCPSNQVTQHFFCIYRRFENRSRDSLSLAIPINKTIEH